jgi:hypothetical protein
MIEINLLPEELKVKVKTESKGKEFDLKKLLYLIPLVVGVLLCVHLLLAVVAVVKGGRLKSLEKQWKGMQSQAN